MSLELASRAIDAGLVLGALRDAGVVGSELRSLTLDRAWPWRDEGLCALFVDRHGAPGRREWTVLQVPGGTLPRRLRRRVDRGELRRLDSLGGIVLPPAGDPELPITDLLDGDLAAIRLRRWLGGVGPARRLNARSRGYKPLRRMTVEYRCEDGDGGGGARLFGKALRPRDLARVEATWAALAGSPAAACLALPRAVVRSWNMLLSDPRPGTALDRLIPGPAAVRGVALAGEALAGLHGGGVTLPQRHPRRRESETLDSWLRCAARACPEMAARLDAARRYLARLGGRPRLGPPVPSHRDYHPGQLLVAPQGASILDLDTAAMAEPELDAGNFLAHLDLFELERRSVPTAELGRVFRSAYERRSGRRLDSRRLLWYRAGAVLRLACVYRFRPRGAILGVLLTRRCLDLLDSGADSLEVI
jgi:hypothetical protein